jgi:hypothetical protein
MDRNIRYIVLTGTRADGSRSIEIYDRYLRICTGGPRPSTEAEAQAICDRRNAEQPAPGPISDLFNPIERY